MNTVSNQRPSFGIFVPYAEKKRVETLIHCFLERKTLQREALPSNFVPSDGKVYTAVYDECRFPADRDEVEVLISFQQHTYGNFAVVRIAKV